MVELQGLHLLLVHPGFGPAALVAVYIGLINKLLKYDLISENVINECQHMTFVIPGHAFLHKQKGPGRDYPYWRPHLS